MPARRKTDLSTISKRAKRQRLHRAKLTDEDRSARLAAGRERQRQYHRNKKSTVEGKPMEQVRIQNVRSLRPNTHKWGSERDWLEAVKIRMHSEKVWLNSMKERLNSDKGRLSIKGGIIKNGVHHKPQNHEKGTLNCEKDLLNSETDLLNLVNDGLNSNPNFRGETQTVQDLDTNKVSIKLEIFDN